MYKANPSVVLLFCISGLIVIAFIKFFNPNLLFLNSALILIILLTIFIKKDFYTKLFGFLSVLLILSTFLKTGLYNESWRLAQQLLVCTVAITTTFVVVHMKKLYRSIEGDRKRMNALFEFATEGILLTDVNGKIVLVNPEAQRLFLYEEQEMFEKKIEELIPDRNGSAHLAFDDDNVSVDSKGINKQHVWGIKKNGVEFPVEVSLSRFEHQKEVFVLAFIVDISQRKESENKLVQQKNQLERITHDIRKMNVELENKVAERTLILQEALQELERSQMELSEALNKEKELNEIKSRFVSMASHEFRTPLSTVLSSASLLSKYHLTEDQDKREKHIHRIKDSVKHLNDLLEDFLNLGKLEEGRVFTQVDNFDVKEFLIDVFEEMKTLIKEGQQFKLNYEGDVCFVTDKRLLKNVLINLLSNAIKFSGENKDICINVANSGTQLFLEIQDEGMGIPKEDMLHLFSTFYRGKNAVNIQGTGLGLHIVKRYVDMLEGQISVSSELNLGTTINIGLPRLQESA